MFVLTFVYPPWIFCLYQSLCSGLYDAEYFFFLSCHWYMKVALISLISDAYSLTQAYFL